jgi:hypothetical protein
MEEEHTSVSLFGKKAAIYDCSHNAVQKQNGIDVLLKKYGFLQDPPAKYLGCFDNNIAECNMGTRHSTERFDPADVFLNEFQDCLVEGETYTVVIRDRYKKTVFQRWIDGPLYKWETQSGLFLCLSQTDVDTLSQEELKIMRIL